ncbi:2-octaprenyl-3-methyl-6-methoxy-1,4-benzoquinol hydroxylase [Vibrio tapetis subsp. quintayensis]|uniref:2-octaprenyl-3-methyl-6-methoxy-1,4-benzoquinol hydroxylase n=1 Tax=Vibrio tapetis TaxID=52443 RepID=UPI0025B5466D|nr:2-octaprenyl-3-methyl-6-methoxy-1,4-benzoquinol hydroxylase [Vibrio tapetis]MDN3681323.1 2-octaprenyl-3-methyl-6-methoxy-1,4-benzoquinol hydroxylase [Vibrio tapetis subsp. quintayensis]
MDNQQFEVAIVGGGMVGAALAVGFAKQGKQVALIEGFAPSDFSAEQAMDIRVSAISQTSVDLLNQLNSWSHTKGMRVCPYRRLETWEHPECRTRFSADSLQLDQLGFIVENRLIQLGLWQEFSNYSNLVTFCPDSMTSMDFTVESNTLHLSSGQSIDAQWVLGADGANSKVRELAGIGVTAWDYRQHCMLVNVKTELAQQDITWQQFTPTGPRSFLPLCGHQGSLVWYDSPNRIRQLVNLAPEKLRDEILKHFPQELGDIEVLQAGAFPLTRRHAQTYVAQRCVLVGDAAHTINPLAGQGVNLGFKDVAALLMAVEDKGLTAQAMSQYQRTRRCDNLIMQSGMDVFYKGFSNDLAPLKFARNAILKLADQTGPVKQKVLKYALGL